MHIRRLASRNQVISRYDAGAETLTAQNQNEWAGRMYAITFDMDTKMLDALHPGSHGRNAYADIAQVLKDHGFFRQQGSVYFGTKATTPVHCVLAIQDLARRHPWFVKAVNDVRMLRVEENNDLMPAVGQLDLPLSPSDCAVG